MKNSIIIVLLILGACATQKVQPVEHIKPAQVGLLNDNQFRLVKLADDKSYGYTTANPVKVGGAKEKMGPKNERRFLNALRGPKGEELRYVKAGSCCQFKTPNGTAGSGMLDRYKIFWPGRKDTLSIYINMYDKGPLQIPVGLTADK